MKKFCIAVTLSFLFMHGTFAYYTEEETCDIDVLRAQGYSESVIIISDVAKSKQEGIHKTSKRHFYKKEGKGKLGRAYTYLKNYIDPYQDDGQFGEHQIQFTNTWNGDVPGYAKAYDCIENL